MALLTAGLAMNASKPIVATGESFLPFRAAIVGLVPLMCLFNILCGSADSPIRDRVNV